MNHDNFPNESECFEHFLYRLRVAQTVIEGDDHPVEWIFRSFFALEVDGEGHLIRQE